MPDDESGTARDRLDSVVDDALWDAEHNSEEAAVLASRIMDAADAYAAECVRLAMQSARSGDDGCLGDVAQAAEAAVFATFNMKPNNYLRPSTGGSRPAAITVRDFLRVALGEAL